LIKADLDAASFTSVTALSFDRTVPIRQGLAIGDACAMIPPFTGNGMAMAFQSAAIALEPLTRYARRELSWSDACAETRRKLARQFRTRLLAAEVLHPFLLRPQRQRGLMVLGRARMLPFRPLFALLH
jgi:2-polyprenyl-6-methoxyphenol hydroxylase-like FAD-dependent oxidoreductase